MYLAALTLACWIDRILCSTATEDSNSQSKCRICHSGDEKLNEIDGPLGEHGNVGSDRTSEDENGLQNLMKDDILKPVHLICSLRRIWLSSIFGEAWLEQLCKDNTQEWLKSSLAYMVRLEIEWLKIFINNLKGPASTEKALLENKIYTEVLYSNRLYSHEKLLEYVSERLPECVKSFIGSALINSENKSNSVTWNNILLNPYLFYSKFSGDFKEVLEIYGLENKENKIIEEIDNILLEVYYSPDSKLLLERNALIPIFIMHLIIGKQIVWQDIVAFHNVPLSIDYFAASRDFEDFKRLIYNLGIASTTFTRIPLKPHLELLINFIKNEKRINPNEIKIISHFWIANLVLQAPYERLVFICYILFKANMMNDLSIRMVFCHAFFIRRLFAINQEMFDCQFEKTTIERKQDHDENILSFCSYKDMYRIIEIACLQETKPSGLEDIMGWNKKSAIKTCHFFKEIYAELSSIIDEKNETQINDDN